MSFDELGEWTIQIGAAELPAFIRELNSRSAPQRLTLPTGESLRDATRMTALKCHCLLLARTVPGAWRATENALGIGGIEVVPHRAFDGSTAKELETSVFERAYPVPYAQWAVNIASGPRSPRPNILM